MSTEGFSHFGKGINIDGMLTFYPAKMFKLERDAELDRLTYFDHTSRSPSPKTETIGAFFLAEWCQAL